MSRILFTGDSVTDCGRRDDPEGLGDGYVRVIANALPGETVINTGISGNRMRDLASRWQADVLDHAPSIVTVLMGINDTWRRYDSNSPTTAEEFEEQYRGVLAATPATTLVLMEPFVLPVTEEQDAWYPEDLSSKIAVVQRLASEFDAILVPTFDALTQRAAETSAAELAADGVHPTALGHEFIAALWLEHVPVT